MRLSARSLKNLEGVHPDLVRLMEVAAETTKIKFVVTEGLRTVERQEKLLADGKSKTMNSRHLTGHAIDFAVVIGDKVTWDYGYYAELAKHIKFTAKHLGVPITWGGDWDGFRDGTHVQLTWKDYPLSKHPKTVQNSKTVAAAATGFPIAAFLPEAFNAIKEFTGYLTGMPDEIVKWAQIAAVIAIAAFIIHERVIKINRDGD
jgi:peptidoglycan L-alanyl-D-glutamate endopeptidase CwlK